MIKKEKYSNKAVQKTIGEIIKEYREMHGLTKEEIASFFDDKIERIDAWEDNVSEPTITECKILSRLFAVPLDDMFGLVDISLTVSNMNTFEQISNRNRLSKRWYE